MKLYRLAFAALLLAAFAIAAPLAQTQPEHAPPAAPAAAAATPQQDAAAGHGEAAAEEHHDPGWMPTVWKAANFLILVGALVYFLRAPVMAYLHGRIAKVREDLVTAKQTRETAARQLAEIDAKLAALPAELAALKVRGGEDLAAEQARIEQEAQAERQRVLEHTRREIEMRLRVAKRELLELGANLAVNVASERIKTSITPDDQARLVDRYASQLGEARQ
jgi:F-type H+-transporting ATPase subunit b